MILGKVAPTIIPSVLLDIAHFRNMLYNDVTPEIEIDPETYKVKINGEIATVEPASKLSLARLYSLY